jgi:hypothetical protein
MRALGGILLWIGVTVAATSYEEGFRAQAENSRGGMGTGRGMAAAAADDYTCTKSKKCKIGCCGALYVISTLRFNQLPNKD